MFVLLLAIYYCVLLFYYLSHTHFSVRMAFYIEIIYYFTSPFTGSITHLLPLYDTVPPVVGVIVTSLGAAIDICTL